MFIESFKESQQPDDSNKTVTEEADAGWCIDKRFQLFTEYDHSSWLMKIRHHATTHSQSSHLLAPPTCLAACVTGYWAEAVQRKLETWVLSVRSPGCRGGEEAANCIWWSEAARALHELMSPLPGLEDSPSTHGLSLDSHDQIWMIACCLWEHWQMSHGVVVTFSDSHLYDLQDHGIFFLPFMNSPEYVRNLDQY